MEKSVLVQLSHVAAAYEGKKVLDDVNLQVFADDFLGIIGPNGGGKTTLLKVVMQLLNPVAGEVSYFQDRQPVSHIQIGYLPQYHSIDKKFPITVREVVLSGLLKEKSALWHRYTREQRDRADEIISRMGLERLEDTAIGKLSGGQMQRTLLGRALVADPRLLILDEPNTYIDKRYEAKLYELLAEINRKCAVMLVSHDIGTVLQHVKSIACVDGTLHYHPDTEVAPEWIEEHIGCPIDLLGHGGIPHRILRAHSHEETIRRP